MPRLTSLRKRALDGMMKEALFEATVAAMRKHGVDGLTMDRVALEAGIAKGSLYHYFASKRELVEFVFAKLIDPILRDMEEIVLAEGPAIEKLAGQLLSLFEHVARHAQIHKLLFENEATHGILQSSERRTAEVGTQRLARVFQQGIAEGVFRPADPVMLAHMYLGLCRAVLESQPQLDTLEQRENLRALILGTFLNGIATDKGRVA
ncbi:MAG: TetR/AcrR family transcriptional regulator [Planctomycetaceae bacterium]|nr:TetR/AcrR family transcriptional regulator [Planctomycetaceae bacterium]